MTADSRILSDRFPRSSKYHPEWIVANASGGANSLLANRLPKETQFLIGKAAEAILSAAALFSPSGLKLENAIHLVDRTPIHLGPFIITPFLVDHSAYDSYAFLVEADGKRLFY